MKNKPFMPQKWLPIAAAVLAVFVNARAQTKVLVNAFHTETEVSDNNGNPWGNWFGTAYYQATWDSSDASNNVNSGSLYIQAYYPDSGIGGCCGPQFVVYNGNNGIMPPLVGNGGPASAALATNVEFDVRFDASSFYNTNTGNWPTIEVGTRGVDFGQHDFGTFTIPASETGWTHVSIPIGADANWTSIPNIFFKYYTTTYVSGAGDWLRLYIDNIVFTTAAVPIIPPTMAMEKAKPGLRMFAGPSQYSRSQLVSTDENQSWVGGTYPVSYSFTISGYDVNPALNQAHVFLIPLSYVNGGTVDQFTDYSTAQNSVRLQLVANTAGDPTMTANIAWKTGLVNSDPTNVVLRITNSTAVGTWTLTFNSATDGTLTAPGANPSPFTIPADAAAQFANPLVVFFGLLPNTTTAIGQHVDYTKFQTVGVASPGVPINSDFTTQTGIDTNVWRLTAAAAAINLVPVGPNSRWWLDWSYPDYGATLGTVPDLSSGIPWKTPLFYTGSTNALFKGTFGQKVWSLVPAEGLPTIDGTTNGVKSPTAYFRISDPPPAE